jgi:hypothetical protein
MKPAITRDASVAEFGFISSGPFPSKALTPLQLLWLSFASASYLEATNLNLSLEAFHENGPLLKPEIQEVGTSLQLPDLIKWSAPAFSGTTLGKQLGLPSYPNGRLVGQFSVNAVTNLLAFQVPIAFTFSLFSPQPGPGPKQPEDGVCFELLSGLVTNISRLEYSGDFLPTLSGKATVQELRFEKELGYGIALAPVRGKWPRRDDPGTRLLLSQYRQSHPVSAPTPDRTRVTRLAVILVACVTGVFFAWLLMQAGKRVVNK